MEAWLVPHKQATFTSLFCFRMIHPVSVFLISPFCFDAYQRVESSSILPVSCTFSLFLAFFKNPPFFKFLHFPDPRQSFLGSLKAFCGDFPPAPKFFWQTSFLFFSFSVFSGVFFRDSFRTSVSPQIAEGLLPLMVRESYTWTPVCFHKKSGCCELFLCRRKDYRPLPKP